MEFHAWPFIVVCGCVVQLISWLNEKAISKWGVALCTLSLNIFLLLTASQSLSKLSQVDAVDVVRLLIVCGGGCVCVCMKVCVRDGGINISINVATVPASELPETAYSASLGCGKPLANCCIYVHLSFRHSLFAVHLLFRF